MTLYEMLIKHEGLRLKPYKCTAGKLTIGVGRNLEDVGISEEEALDMLENDIIRCIYQCEQNIINFSKLCLYRQWVLIDMCFNLGINGLLKFKNMLHAIETEDFGLAADEMIDSRWAAQVGQYFGQRAYELSMMMRTGRID